MTNDIISDLLTRIRNAVERKSLSVVAPSARMVNEVCKILKDEDYITDFVDNGKRVTISLKYIANKAAIMHLERVSKPGLRSYIGYTDIPRVLNGLGISILSTSKGIMTGKKARLEKVGGEFLCKIW